ncbi:ADP-glyceromanno-heptose 6-epimerase [Candidatus Micrarchaeota archaeon]|nr:ADP-glyceromanno-heptose 6-epimerase [Candidatus Micrarchaeota archaeon]
MGKILLTGGAGFIGANIAIKLQKMGNEIVIVDNLFSGTKKNLVGFDGQFIEADVTKPLELEGKFDAIIHQAAITDARFGNEEMTLKTNLDGFGNILGFAKKHSSKLVYASSASIYGNGKVPFKEDQKPDLFSAYAKSKFEMDAIAGAHFGEMQIVGLRYFNVFGPLESHKGRPASMVYHLIKQVMDGKNPRIFKWGEQIRDHIYVKDVVDATILAMDAKSGIYNVGTGIGTSFKDLANTIIKSLKSNSKIEYFDSPYGKDYQYNTQADISKARSGLGFKAKWNLEEGILDYIKWLEKTKG